MKLLDICSVTEERWWIERALLLMEAESLKGIPLGRSKRPDMFKKLNVPEEFSVVIIEEVIHDSIAMSAV